MDGRKLNAHLAWLAGEVENDVKAGENRGRKLRHDFVALSIDTQPLDPQTGAATFTTKRPDDAKAVADAYGHGGYVDTETPPFLISFMGWFLLVGFPVIIYFLAGPHH